MGDCYGYPPLSAKLPTITCLLPALLIIGTYPLFGKLMLEDGLARPLPTAQVSFKSYVPSMKIYFSHTTVWDPFEPLINSCCF